MSQPTRPVVVAAPDAAPFIVCPADADAADDDHPSGPALARAAAAFLAAARDYDRAHSDPPEDADRMPHAVEWALLALASAVALDAGPASPDRPAGLRLTLRPHGDKPPRPRTVPTGRPSDAKPADVGAYVAGPWFMRSAVEVDRTCLGPGLRSEAVAADFHTASAVAAGDFADLVAVAALSRFDLPLGPDPKAEPAAG